MTQLISLVYRSVQTAPFTPSALHHLVERARIRNRRLNLTGVLLHDGTGFMQCIEGPASSVDAVYASIVADSRHRNCSVLRRAPLETREFGSWSMGYVPMFGQEQLEALHRLGLAGGALPRQSARRLLSGFFRLEREGAA